MRLLPPLQDDHQLPTDDARRRAADPTTTPNRGGGRKKPAPAISGAGTVTDPFEILDSPPAAQRAGASMSAAAVAAGAAGIDLDASVGAGSGCGFGGGTNPVQAALKLLQQVPQQHPNVAVAMQMLQTLQQPQQNDEEVTSTMPCWRQDSNFEAPQTQQQ